jgi:hypothetical protein
MLPEMDLLPSNSMHTVDKQIYRYMTVALLAIAPGLRLRGLDEGIWVDEWRSIYMSQGGRLLETLTKLRGYDHPPLYYMILHLWSQVGNNKVFLRLPPVLTMIGPSL